VGGSTTIPLASPVASHTLSPLLDDTSILIIIDHFLAAALTHPALTPFYTQIDRRILRHKLAGFICQLFGGLPYNKAAMQRAHHKLSLDNTHFDAVMEVLDRVFDIEVDGKRVVSWRMKVMAMREAEELRHEIIHPDVKPKRVERKVADVLERRMDDHHEAHKLGVTEASVLNLSIGVLPEQARHVDHLERYSDHSHSHHSHHSHEQPHHGHHGHHGHYTHGHHESHRRHTDHHDHHDHHRDHHDDHHTHSLPSHRGSVNHVVPPKKKNRCVQS
jgi:hypothetical protein